MMFDIVVLFYCPNSLFICGEVLALFLHVVIMSDFRLTNAASHAYLASRVTSPQVIRVC